MTVTGGATSVAQFSHRFPDEAACLSHVFERILADGLICPSCGAEGEWRKVVSTKKYYHTCKYQISPAAHTCFAKSNVSLLAWFYVMLLFANTRGRVNSAFLQRHIGVGIKAAHRMGNVIRRHIASLDRPSCLGGNGKKVYVDEAIITFTRSNYGRDFEGEESNSIILGFACEGKVISGVVPDRKTSTLIKAISRFVAPGSIIVTDAFTGYTPLERHGWRHIKVNHSIAFHDFEGNNTNQIEVYWSVLKRNLRMYRQVGENYLWLYLAQIEYFYNHRHAKDSAFERLIFQFPPTTVDDLARVRQRFDWR